MWVAFANEMQKLLTCFQQNISIYVIFNYQSFNDTLTNDIVSFEQLSTDWGRNNNKTSEDTQEISQSNNDKTYIRHTVESKQVNSWTDTVRYNQIHIKF